MEKKRSKNSLDRDLFDDHPPHDTMTGLTVSNITKASDGTDIIIFSGAAGSGHSETADRMSSKNQDCIVIKWEAYCDSDTLKMHKTAYCGNIMAASSKTDWKRMAKDIAESKQNHKKIIAVTDFRDPLSIQLSSAGLPHKTFFFTAQDNGLAQRLLQEKTPCSKKTARSYILACEASCSVKDAVVEIESGEVISENTLSMLHQDGARLSRLLKGKTFVITGGAGYIGSDAARTLSLLGAKVFVIDNFFSGHPSSVAGYCDGIFDVDMADTASVLQAFKETGHIDGILHCAASIEAGESMERPIKYYAQNTANTVSLLYAMKEHGVKNLVFSSTAAVYGQPIPDELPITENNRNLPVNPYGMSKLLMEQAIAEASKKFEIKTMTVRYFNVAGASDPDSFFRKAFLKSEHTGPPLENSLVTRIRNGDIISRSTAAAWPFTMHGESHHPKETHILPNAASLSKFSLFGTSYPTRDGTCIRDYVHLFDLTRAHLLCFEKILANTTGAIVNLGTGVTVSNLEAVFGTQRARLHDGRPQAEVVVTGPRAGDPAELHTENKTARHLLGWQPLVPFAITAMEAVHWAWLHPDRYGELTDRAQDHTDSYYMNSALRIMSQHGGWTSAGFRRRFFALQYLDCVNALIERYKSPNYSPETQKRAKALQDNDLRPLYEAMIADESMPYTQFNGLIPALLNWMGDELQVKLSPLNETIEKDPDAFLFIESIVLAAHALHTSVLGTHTDDIFGSA